MRRIIIGAAAALAITAFCGSRPAPAQASEPYGCITFEDDSFVCGTLEPSREGWSDTWVLARDRPWISGCIPGGLCDTPDTADQPYSEVIFPTDWAGWNPDYQDCED